jgi:hypothetical protein
VKLRHRNRPVPESRFLRFVKTPKHELEKRRYSNTLVTVSPPMDSKYPVLRIWHAHIGKVLLHGRTREELDQKIWRLVKKLERSQQLVQECSYF